MSRLDVAERSVRYVVTADVPDCAHHVPVRLIADTTDPRSGTVFYVRRELFGAQLRRVNA